MTEAILSAYREERTMIDRNMSSFDELLPGDRVRVVDDTFVGLEGIVLSEEEVRKLRKKNPEMGGPLTRWPPGSAYVLLTLFDREVPIFLERNQMQRIGL
jgi:transcription antitermination factor NusG